MLPAPAGASCHSPGGIVPRESDTLTARPSAAASAAARAYAGQFCADAVPWPLRRPRSPPGARGEIVQHAVADTQLSSCSSACPMPPRRAA